MVTANDSGLDAGGLAEVNENPWIVRNVHRVSERPGTRQRYSVPTVNDLTVAPSVDSYRYFVDDHEKLTANGVKNLRSVLRRSGEAQKTPDTVFSFAGVDATLEIKSLDQPSENALHQNVRGGRKQSGIVVIDGRAAGLVRSAGEAGLRLAVRHYGRDVDQIVVVLADGTALGWKP